MKLIASLWVAVAALAQGANLEFAETQKEVRPAAEAETVAIEYAFTNRSDKPINISKADAGCTCMKVLFSGGKLSYAPGEGGVMRAIFKLGQASGTVDRKISLWLDTDPKEPATQAVKARIVIPTVIALEPRTLKWESGGKAEPQTIRIRMAEGKTIHVTGVKAPPDQFACEVKALEEGRQYDVVVTPRTAANTGVTVLEIETDCEIPKLRVQQAYAMVYEPEKAAVAGK